MQALDNVIVLDLTHHIAGPYATKLMANFGADVIKIERPEGDIARYLGPFQGGEPDTEKSGLFFYLNTNKRSVTLDLATEPARRAMAALAQRADIVVENFAPGVLDELDLGWEFFHAIKPELSLVSVTNFGQDGPYRDFKLSDLVLYAFSGEMYTMGMTDREPVKMAGTAACFESGASIAAALMGTLWASKKHGTGQHVDISLSETHFGGVDRRHATAIAYQFSSRKTLRAASTGAGMPNGIYPCADGYMDFTNASLRYDRVVDMLGSPEWATDPKYMDPVSRLDPNIIEEWTANFLMWCLERTKREVWAEGRRAKVLCGPLFTMQDLFEDEHFRGRGFWHEVEHPDMGKVTIPGRPFQMARGGWAIRRPAPRLGEHTVEVLREAGLREDDLAAISAAGVGS
ncbi:MAG TPA: CoA transferase [Tepidiformaceae bacterium]|nr:CoA transferase [Tepidiformaceae bacterium]